MLQAAADFHRLLEALARDPTNDRVRRLVLLFQALHRRAYEASAAGTDEQYADGVVEFARRAAVGIVADAVIDRLDPEEWPTLFGTT